MDENEDKDKDEEVKEDVEDEEDEGGTRTSDHSQDLSGGLVPSTNYDERISSLDIECSPTDFVNLVPGSPDPGVRDENDPYKELLSEPLLYKF